MARGTTLANLRTMFKAEVGIDLSAGTGEDTAINNLLANKEMWLASEFDWPFLEHKFDLIVGSGDRFKTLPTTESSSGDEGATAAMNFDRPFLVETKFNAKWVELEYGIGSQEMNYLDSELAPPQVMDPVQRWRFATDISEAVNPNQIEIWPIPATTQLIRFTGQRQLLTLVSDSDKADLDDLLIVLFVAAEWLTKNQSQEAQMKGQLAQARLNRLRGTYPQRSRRVILGGTEPGEVRRVVPGVVIVTH
jgi:hypothetical protein